MDTCIHHFEADNLLLKKMQVGPNQGTKVCQTCLNGSHLSVIIIMIVNHHYYQMLSIWCIAVSTLCMLNHLDPKINLYRKELYKPLLQRRNGIHGEDNKCA